MTKRKVVPPMINDFRGEHYFLSNTYKCDIKVKDPITGEMQVYPSNEHAFHACKTLIPAERELIRTQAYWRDAKAIGQKVALRDGWDKREGKPTGLKVDVMLAINRHKYNHHPKLAKRLLDTYPVSLVEGNLYHCNYWGNCACPGCKNIVGVNMLGKILEKVRWELKQKEGLIDLSLMIEE